MYDESCTVALLFHMRKTCRMEVVSTSGNIDFWNIYGGAEGTLLGGGGEEGRECDSTTPPKEMKLAQDKRAPSTWMVR